MATNYNEFINKLSSLTGLHTDVVAAWVAKEGGGNPATGGKTGNVLGVTSTSLRTPSNPHGLVTYANQTEGAIATAKLIQTSPNYAGIRASESGTSAQQALAIAKSPWRLGGIGLQKAGGTDPYYLAGFSSILSGSPSIPAGGTSTPITPDTSSPSTSSTDIASVLAKLGLTDPTHILTEADSTRIVAALGFPNDKTLMAFFTGHTVGETIAKANSQFGIDTGGLPNIDIPGALMFVAVILVGITFIILGGIIVLRKPK